MRAVWHECVAKGPSYVVMHKKLTKKPPGLQSGRLLGGSSRPGEVEARKKILLLLSCHESCEKRHPLSAGSHHNPGVVLMYPGCGRCIKKGQAKHDRGNDEQAGNGPRYSPSLCSHVDAAAPAPHRREPAEPEGKHLPAAWQASRMGSQTVARSWMRNPSTHPPTSPPPFCKSPHPPHTTISSLLPLHAHQHSPNPPFSYDNTCWAAGH